MCFRGLLKRRVRTFLCTLGIALSVMLILGVGLTTMNYVSIVKELNTFYQGKVVVVSKGSFFIQTIPIGSILPETIADRIKQEIEGVKSATPMLVIIDISETTFSPLNISVGIPEGNWSVLVGSTPLKAGSRWPNSTNPDSMEVVVGGFLAERDGLGIGSEIKMKNYGLTVVGILLSPSAFLSRVIIMPLKVAQEIYRYPKMVNLVVVEPVEELSEAELDDRLESTFPTVEALTYEERSGFVEPFFRDIVNWNTGLSSVIFAIDLVLVTAITIMNISERRREIATLYAIGAPKGFVVRVLTLETTLIGLFGGLLGITLGIILAIFLFSFYGSIPLTYMIQHVREIAEPFVVSEILAITVALCFFGGLIPALATAKKSITESLRSEY